MKLYVLDTDTCIYWLKGIAEIRRQAESRMDARLATTIVSVAELRFGAYYSQRVEANLQSIRNLLRGIQVLTLNDLSADTFGRLKAELRRTGQLLDDFDLLIAAMTISYEGVLVTNNVRHFGRVSGLRIENWLDG